MTHGTHNPLNGWYHLRGLLRFAVTNVIDIIRQKGVKITFPTMGMKPHAGALIMSLPRFHKTCFISFLATTPLWILKTAASSDKIVMES